ncbi:carboxypeptidase-like regulatory domain-containing protein [Clostridium sp. 'White wine YQ']|uniref:carboxypeptidase-like regulatory domain-containing protein n=1 Tax=Clostridium sp. 'White wine YQ' TaxID=3027474 RepID=UPI0023655593|nr:carboxypeptidase-like regulatory domain-containing protein [Clostridium sp. 'White wine YQ']MDD7794728.1 carboxypeptidase-like regulatory domain-containing protein [Clostridium sp. 'White wine YQ']
MSRDNKPSNEEVEVEVLSEKEASLSNQESHQKNVQDLDQEQSVVANPLQLNSQNVNLVLSDEKKDYSGKITGMTYLDKYNSIVPDVTILLYFGNDSEYPVYKTKSDKSGKYFIDNIPPGYYTIEAYIGKEFVYSSHYIKVLPCEKVEHLIFLKYINKRKNY